MELNLISEYCSNIRSIYDEIDQHKSYYDVKTLIIATLIYIINKPDLNFKELIIRVLSNIVFIYKIVGYCDDINDIIHLIEIIS